MRAMEPPPVVVKPDDPLVIAMLIDTSGSMEGEPIDEVKEAAIRYLETSDRTNTHVAVVSFSNDAQLLEPILLPSGNPQPLVDQMRRFEAYGGTGMALALRQAQSAFSQIGSSRNAVMLFTDGQPNRKGLTLRLARTMRSRGVVIVAIGTKQSLGNYLRNLAGDDSNVFTTRLGDFASAFDQAARAIAASSFGTTSTEQGLVVVAVVAFLLATALLAVENVWGLRGNWWRDMWWLPALSMVLGYVGGAIGENLIGGGFVSWGLVGLSCGAALGLTDIVGGGTSGPRRWLRLPLKSKRGAAFGLFGSLAGYVMFQLIYREVNLESSQGEFIALLSRAAGFAAIGFCTGLAIKIGQEMLKDAWLLGISKGFYEGKQYILGKSPVNIGRTGNNDINLLRESDISPNEGHFVLDQGRWYYSRLPEGGSSGAVTISGKAVSDKVPLFDNDSIRFGNTEFVFQRRGDSGANAREANWVLASDTKMYALPSKDRIKIGSSEKCDIVIYDSSINRIHCTLKFTEQGLSLKSSSGASTSVNDQPLSKREQRLLQQGDLIALGTIELGLIKRQREDADSANVVENDFSKYQ